MFQQFYDIGMNWITFRQWTWELPQTLLGLILLQFYKKTLLKSFTYKNQIVYIYDKFPGGISLGRYTLVDYNRKDWNNKIIRLHLKNSIKHEYGHSIQSKWYGWLYLPIPGLCSVYNNIRCRIKRWLGKDYDYYSFWTERQANKLGGVE